MCKAGDREDGLVQWTCSCSTRVGGCNNPRSLCKCSSCDCSYTYDKRKHEIDRINQFEEEARDDAHFKQKILNRAAKCGTEKRARFIKFLKEIGRVDLASFIEMTMRERV